MTLAAIDSLALVVALLAWLAIGFLVLSLATRAVRWVRS